MFSFWSRYSNIGISLLDIQIVMSKLPQFVSMLLNTHLFYMYNGLHIFQDQILHKTRTAKSEYFINFIHSTVNVTMVGNIVL